MTNIKQLNDSLNRIEKNIDDIDLYSKKLEEKIEKVE